MMSKRPGVSPAPLTLAKKRKALQHQSNKEDQVVLDRVLGLTCVNSNGLAVCDVSGCIAYPAGCITVLYLPKRNKQLHVLNTSRRPISCLCLSPDGKYLATGESGHDPCVRVWDISSSPSQVAELKGHRHGITCIVFSPKMRYLVSVGYQHDQTIHLWSWKTGTSLASNKITSIVHGVAFSDDGRYFVTVGNRRVRFWYLETSGRDERLNRASPLKGRSAILGQLQDNCFMAVSCGRGPLAKNTYALTRSGLLCLFDQKRQLDRFTEVKASPAYSLALSEQYLFCGCSEGVIRIFDPYTLDYLITMPKPHSLRVNIAAALDASQFSSSGGEGEKYPDVVAIVVDETNKRMTVAYNDHSLYVWDLKNICQIGKLYSFLYHNACIWDICVYPQLADKSRGLLPEMSFVTCASDNTIRFWCLDSAQEGSGFIKNIYSKDLMRIIYTDSDTNTLRNMSTAPGDARAVADVKRGVRSIQFHPNGQHIAAGDRAGNLNVYDLQFMDKIFEVEAHDSEVLCIEYSPQFEGHQFMATASRDRLIHIFTTNGSYQHIQTLDDHSASITSIKFTTKDNIHLLTCGADKSIMFRTLEKTPELSFQRSNHIVGKATMYDMDIDVTGKHMATAGQDRVLRIYNTATGKQKSFIKLPSSEDGSLLKVTIDPSGLYAATSSSDKAVSLFDFYSGECLARLYGHSEVVTQVRFSRDCKYLYSVSGDSCIFVWRLSRELTQMMHDRLAEIGKPVSPSAQLTPARPPPKQDEGRRETYSVAQPATKRAATDQTDAGDDDEESASFRLSVSQLPAWAQKQVISRPSIARSISTSVLERATGESKAPVPIGGRWAQRVSEGGVVFASEGQEGRPESDTEMEDLSAEMTKVMDEQEVEVIDLTDEEPSSPGGGYVTVRGEEGIGEEPEEVIYPTLRASTPDVDPSTFTVTTPDKPPHTEVDGGEDSQNDDSSGNSTPDSSPKLEKQKDGFDFEGENFLKVNFESLSAEQMDKFFSAQPFDPQDSRLSISAKFLSQSWKKEQAKGTQGWPAGARSVAVHSSPKLFPPTDHKTQTNSHSKPPPHSICSKMEPQSHTSDKGTIPSSVEKPTSQNVMETTGDGSPSESQSRGTSTAEEVPGRDDVVMPLLQEEAEDWNETGNRKPNTRSSKRSERFEEEICKTKKRLEELGYSVPKDKDVAIPIPVSAPRHKTAKVKPRRAHLQDGIPQSESGVTTSQSTCSVTSTDSSDEPAVALCTTPPQEAKGSQLSRLNKLIEAMNETFREITVMHENAMEDLKQERHQSDTEEVIATVATAVNSIKNQAVSMSNKYRKKWRGRDKHSRYSLRSTPTRGEESIAENSHSASIPPGAKSEATAGLMEVDKDRHPLTIKTSKSSENLESASSSTSSLPNVETRPPTTEAAMEANDSTRHSTTDAAVQLLTDPNTVEVLKNLLKQSEKLTAHGSE